MTTTVAVAGYAAITTKGLLSRAGQTAWEDDQHGPADVKRAQVLDKPYPSYGKLMLPDKLAFSVASLLLSSLPEPLDDRAGVSIALDFGSLPTDLRYNESIAAGFPSPAIFSATLPSSPVSEITIYYKLKGPNRVYAQAGDSGLLALEMAAMALHNGKASAMLAIGVTALDGADRDSPHMPEVDRHLPNRAHALLLRPETADDGVARLTISPQTPAPQGAQVTGTDYFATLVAAAADGREQAISVDSPQWQGTLQLSRG